MAVSRGVIFLGSVERYCYDYRFRTRSLDRSLILIVVTRNKTQLQNARVRVRVPRRVRAVRRRVVPRILPTSECAQAHKRAEDAKEKGGAKTKGGWISMSAVCFEFFSLSLYLSFSLFLFSISFCDAGTANSLLSCVSLPRRGSRSCARRRYGLVPLHYGCVIITYSFSMGT